MTLATTFGPVISERCPASTVERHNDVLGGRRRYGVEQRQGEVGVPIGDGKTRRGGPRRPGYE
jgi:hypothetical protein